MSVSLRLFATIALIFLLSSTGGGLIGYYDARQRIAAELDSAMVVGQASAERAVAALARSFRPAGHLTEFVSLFDGDRHLQASLLGPNGQVIKQSTLLPAERAVPAWFIKLLDPAGRTVRLCATRRTGRLWQAAAGDRRAQRNRRDLVERARWRS